MTASFAAPSNRPFNATNHPPTKPEISAIVEEVTREAKVGKLKIFSG